MALDGGTIAAIVTGILAFLGVLATAWTSGWNESRQQRRKNLHRISLYSGPLLTAAWDLHNWLYDTLDRDNYSRGRTGLYGHAWDSAFTSYLLGRYLAAAHVIGVRTQHFSFVDDAQIERLKVLLWKILDELLTMNHEDRASVEMRWWEGDVLAVQEHMTVPGGEDAEAGGLQVMGFVEFKRNYGEGPGSKNLKAIFAWYENEFQRLNYRRFKRLYPREEDECPAGKNAAFDAELERSEGEWRISTADLSSRITACVACSISWQISWISRMTSRSRSYGAQCGGGIRPSSARRRTNGCLATAGGRSVGQVWTLFGGGRRT